MVASMDWGRLLSRVCLGREAAPQRTDEGRTPFDKDISKILFSEAFRRLGRKTQAHPLATNDHVHTRLTHSLEVGQVGRALGKRLGTILKHKQVLPADRTATDVAAIVQAACLAHDIGNPPFGHAGEEAMKEWFKADGAALLAPLHLKDDYLRDVSLCEGNAQGFRVLTQTENHTFCGGLQLTYATLGAFLKYPKTSAALRSYEKPKFSAYLSEKEILSKVAEVLGLVSLGPNAGWARHPLAYLVEAADDICYAIIDLEDAVELGIMTYEEVKDLLLSPFDGSNGGQPTKEEIVARLETGRVSHRTKLTRLRSAVFDLLVGAAVERFVAHYDTIMDGDGPEDLWASPDPDDSVRKLVDDAKAAAREKIFPTKFETELGSYGTFECLLGTFCRAVLDERQVSASRGVANLGWKSRLAMSLLKDHAPDRRSGDPNSELSTYDCLRRVIDFVSGMTDNYAVSLARQIQGTSAGDAQRL